MNETRARENQAYVRQLLREKQPRLADELAALVVSPCGKGCRMLAAMQDGWIPRDKSRGELATEAIRL
jgi:hypothetical protein